MTVDTSLFVVSPTFQDYIVDKDTGAPLAAGVVTMYQDDSRLTLKNWYYQTGIPGAYTYVALPNPLTLSSVGTISVAGQDVIPYFYPYDESPDAPAQSVQLYYVTVVSSDNVAQFTREGFPYLNLDQGGGAATDQLLDNLLPNGQFAAHQNGPNADGLVENKLSIIAPGGIKGWQYLQVASGDATDEDFITFDYLSQEPSGLGGNPRWATRIKCTSPGNSTEKALGVTFPNVNHFESDSLVYTFGFAASSNSGAPLNVTFALLKNFGTGGSTQQIIPVESFTIPSGEYLQQFVSFTFGSNETFTVGPDNDDEISLLISFPVSSTFNVSLTNFILVPGQVALSSYPDRPDNYVFAPGVVGSGYRVDPTGMDLYLPLMMTPAGISPDDTCIGKPYMSFKAPNDIELLCDGSSYQRTAYSSVGIPYQRLFNIFWEGGSHGGLPLFGTGLNFVSAYSTTAGSASVFTVTQNDAAGSVQSPPADSVAAATGWTFSTARTTDTTGIYNFTAFRNGLNSIYIRGITPNETNIAALSNANAGTSGFTVTPIVPRNETSAPGSSPLTTAPAGPVGVNQEFQVSNILGGSSLIVGSGMAGIYWTFTTPDYQSDGMGAGGITVYYVVNGEIAPSTDADLFVPVNILSADTNDDVAYKTIAALHGGYLSNITPLSGTATPNSSYWTLEANNVNYYVWQNKDDTGVDPKVPGYTGIEVDYAGTATNLQVVQANLLAVNSFIFAVPNASGLFPRVIDTTGVFDYDAATRAGLGNAAIWGAIAGTVQAGQVGPHSHPVPQYSGGGSTLHIENVTTDNTFSTYDYVQFNSGQETRGINLGVYLVMRY